MNAKPGVSRLLIAAAMEPEMRRRLLESPDEVFEEFDLTEEEKDLLRQPDHRLLRLLGAALVEESESSGAKPEAPSMPPPAEVTARTLPDVSLVLTLVPCAQYEDGRLSKFAYGAWVNPLTPGTDPASLPLPQGAAYPGQPLTPLHAVIQVSAVQMQDAAGGPQVGLSAALLRSSNVSAPPSPGASGRSDVTEFGSGPADIWIAGLGLQTVNQVTREVEAAIRASNEVLYLDTGVATRSFLESLCPRVTSLYEESYAEEGSRANAYEHMAARVIDAALDHRPVTFAIHGHPLVATSAPFLVLELAKAAGLRVAVLPGISAIDSILADLRIDPVVHGMQMYEATDLLLRRRPLQADVPAILWQIGPLETCLHSMAVSRPERFSRLIAHLALFYPPRHEVAAIYCSPHPIMPPHILRFAIEDMGEHAQEFHTGFTLYVPPAGSRPIQDYDLLAKLYSVEHLRRISKSG